MLNGRNGVLSTGYFSQRAQSGVYTYCMTTANGSDKEYVEQGRRFLNQAREELSRDDLRQASEKGWGATVQLLKAYADERGLEHDRHAKLFGVVRERLVAESNDDDSLRTYFGVAGGSARELL